MSPLAVDTVERIAVEAAAIDRAWATSVIDVLGEVAYAELAAVVATVVTIDRTCELLGREREPRRPPSTNRRPASGPGGPSTSGPTSRPRRASAGPTSRSR